MPSAAYWERVQKIERAYHERKDPTHIREINLVYWKRILEAARAEGVTIGRETRVLDAGCGGAGVLLGVTDGKLTGVDPLMSFYLEKFPFLKDTPVTWVEGTAEQFDAATSFDVIFSINMLDHTVDPRLSAHNLVRLLAPGGRLALVLNVHLTRFWRLYLSLFYRFVDPPHPHHIHIDDVAGYFPGLKLESRRDIDALWLDLEEQYRREVCHHGGDSGSKRPSIGKYLNVFKYPMAALAKLTGRRFYRKRAEDSSLMVSTLYVFSKPTAR